MPGILYTIRKFLDPVTGQRFEEVDKLRAVAGSESTLVTLALGDVTLLTVPTGKQFIMTNYKVTPVGVGIIGVTNIWNGASAGTDLRAYAESIAAGIAPIQESGIVGKIFDDDVVATSNIAGGAYVEVGGYLIDIDPITS